MVAGLARHIPTASRSGRLWNRVTISQPLYFGFSKLGFCSWCSARHKREKRSKQLFAINIAFLQQFMSGTVNCQCHTRTHAPPKLLSNPVGDNTVIAGTNEQS